jgi:hypothetical protein
MPRPDDLQDRLSFCSRIIGLKTRWMPIAGVTAHSGSVGGTADSRALHYPQDFTVLRIVKSITASEIQSAASTVTTEDPWLECFAASRIPAERARCRSYSLRLGLSRFPLRLLFLFVRVLFLALFLILLASFVAHFVILCYCELLFRKIHSTQIMSPTGSILSNRIQRLSWTSCERLLSLYSAGISWRLRHAAGERFIETENSLGSIFREWCCGIRCGHDP